MIGRKVIIKWSTRGRIFFPESHTDSPGCPRSVKRRYFLFKLSLNDEEALKGIKSCFEERTGQNKEVNRPPKGTGIGIACCRTTGYCGIGMGEGYREKGYSRMEGVKERRKRDTVGQ